MPPAVSVALTPAYLRPAHTIVAVDVLRATSTIVQALAAGTARVRCCATHAGALAAAHPDALLAGERGCVPPPGFQAGNSPAAFARFRAEEVVLATCNGTPLIVRAAALASRVVIASLLNVDAVVAALCGHDVVVACAGTDGEPAIEDTYVAGLLVERLGAPRGDAAHLAAAVARGFAEPAVALASGRGASNLRAAGLERDIADCARRSVVEVVPVVTGASSDVAVVALAETASIDHRLCVGEEKILAV